MYAILVQGCALRKITRSPKVPNYENLVAQLKAYVRKVSLSGCPKAKVSRLRHPGALRAQPCLFAIKLTKLLIFQKFQVQRKQQKKL